MGWFRLCSVEGRTTLRNIGHHRKTSPPLHQGFHERPQVARNHLAEHADLRRYEPDPAHGHGAPAAEV